MEFNQPFYRAPSLPKLSKKNISSSVLRGASAISSSTALKPKLRTSIFRFNKPKTEVSENIAVEQKEGSSSLNDVLNETNRILVEIQNQLALDFAMRIAEEKDQNKKIKAAESKKRFSDKETALEKAKSVGSIFKSQVDKVLAPTKSIFQKIIEFFKVILTGIVVNQGFKWLEKKENREKLGQFFGFLAEHWKWIAATLGTVLLVDVITKVVLAVKGIMAAFALLTSPAGLIILGALALLAAGKALEPATRERLKQAAEAQQGKSLFVPGTGGIGDPYKGLEQQLYGSPTAMPGDFDYGRGVGRKNGGIVPNISNIFKFSRGGTVPGRGAGTVDTVPSMLAAGEYVVNTFATRLFRPFIADINENAGRRFDEFRQAIIGLSNLVFIQSENAKRFRQLLKEFNDIIEKELKKKKSGQGQGGGIDNRTYTPLKQRGDVNTPMMSNVSNVNVSFESTASKTLLSGSAGVMKKPKVLREKTYGSISQSSRPSPKTNFVSMSLPPQKSKLPEIPIPTPKATDVPSISSVNMSDPYRMITSKMYGIYV